MLQRLASPCSVSAFAAFLALALSHGAAPVYGEEEKAQKQVPEFSKEHVQFFENQVRPLLAQHCHACHGAKKQRGGLRLDFRGGLLKGGDSGPAIDLESLDDSLLLSAVNYDGLEMPPKGKLPEAEIAILKRWITLKAPWAPGADEPPAAAAHHKSPEVNDETRGHWAFQRVERPKVPKVEGATHPIDAFVLRKLEQAGLKPSPSASKQTLIRRLYYNLLGLPPTPEQVAAFVEDSSPNAYEKLVDSLLESPHYGERWARHWLDLVRYAETNSYERDGDKPFVWRYRDYVIRSFNDDKPFDQFVREQLAGDELDEYSEDAMIATGYYRLGIWDDEPVDPLQANVDDLDDVLATTGQVFLGLTIGCARCHEHKLDPIPQEDYYRMLSFFSNIRRYGVRSHPSVLDASVRMVGSQDDKQKYEQDLAKWKADLQAAESKLREIEKDVRPKLEGGERDDFKREQVRLDILKRGIPRLISKENFEEYERLVKQRNLLRRSQPQGLMQVLCVTEHGPTPRQTHVLVRGNAHAKGDEVEPGFPEVLGFDAPEFPEVSPFPKSSGRRRVLADWMIRRDNPLTARVFVNRIWQNHFGEGLVRTTSDFGLTGTRPTHPELLDWLAVEFMENGWRIKPIQKQIVMSQTFRQGYAANAKAEKADPLNALLWRFNLRRLSAEEIRDSILAVVGTLNSDKMFGPSIFSKIPAEVLAGQSRPGAGWGNSPPEERFRRSIYIHVKRSLLTPILSAFDFPEPDLTCPERFVTTQPTQALAMLNSEFLNEQASLWREKLLARHKDDLAALVRDSLARVTQREPSEAEVKRAVKLVEDLKQEHKLDHAQAVNQYCLMALNLNEFVYLD